MKSPKTKAVATTTTKLRKKHAKSNAISKTPPPRNTSDDATSPAELALTSTKTEENSSTDVNNSTDLALSSSEPVSSDNLSKEEEEEVDEKGEEDETETEKEEDDEGEEAKDGDDDEKKKKSTGDYVNPRGVRFIQEINNSASNATTSTTNSSTSSPYGLPCVRELLRFLISLTSTKNSELMISMGLNLITIGLESGIDYISSFQSLLAYVKDDLLKNLYHLLSFTSTEKQITPPHYASVLRISFLLFESLRTHLKLQMEHFLNKLMDMCLTLTASSASALSADDLISVTSTLSSASSSSSLNTPSNNSAGNAAKVAPSPVSNQKPITQEQKEMTIDYFLQMLRIPGFAVEIYLNYDCSLHCSNLFENLTKLLSKVRKNF